MAVRFSTGFQDTIVQVEQKDNKFNYRDSFLLYVIFVPFNLLWQMCIQVGIVFVILESIYRVFYSPTFNIYMDGYIYYTIELMYLFDTLLSYTHKYTKRLNKYALYLPRNLFLLTVDTVSLIPCYEFYYLIMPDIADKIVFYVRLKSVLRLVHMFYFLLHNRHVTTSNYMYIVIICHMVLFVIITLVMSIIWNTRSCFENCVGPHWSDSLEHYDIDHTDNIQWVTVCFTTMANILLHNWGGILRDRDSFESLQIIACILIGFVLHVMVETGHITNILLETLRRQFDYIDLLYKLNWILEDYKATADIKKNITAFYTTLWKKRNGIVTKPVCFKLLPVSLEKEISLDLFWEALKHSHLFPQLEICVKKEIALVMKNEFLLPGDYLIKPGMHKHRMIYIVSGSVEVLSYEDDSSPIIRFSSGSLLSEICCFYDMVSNSHIRCATDCEIQTLNLNDLAHVFRKYNKETHLIHEMISKRFANAKQLQRFTRNKVYQDTMAVFGCAMITPISRLKRQWRAISKINRLKKKKDFDIKLYNDIDYTVHSSYLDLFVLSDHLELHGSTICLHKSCPYVMEPNTGFRQFLHYLHLCVVAVQTVMIPLWAVFTHSSEKYLHLLNLLFDYIYWFDIYIQTITAIKTNKIVISEPSSILYYRVQSLRFIVDIIASIPYDYFAYLMGFELQTQMYLKLPRVLKCYKIFEFVNKLEKSLKYNHIFMILIKYGLGYSLVMYSTVCILNIFFCFGPKCFNRRITKQRCKLIDESPVLESLYYAMSMICALSFSPRTPLLINEMIAYSCFTLVGSYMYSFFLAELTATMIKLQEGEFKYRDRLKLINNFMVNNFIPNNFRQRARNYVSFQWFNNRNIDLRSILGTHENTVEQELLAKRIMDALKEIPIFSFFPESILRQISPYCVVRMLPPGTVLCEAGDMALHIYVITKGYCQMYCLMPGDAENNVTQILQTGGSFPVIEAFQHVNSLNTITSITAVEVICIDVFYVENVLDLYPRYMDVIKSALDWHMTKYATLLKHIDTTLLFQKKNSGFNIHRLRGKGYPFEYEIDDNDELVHTTQLKKMGIFQYFFMKKTINPNGKLFITWEVMRSIACIPYFVFYLFHHIVGTYEDNMEMCLLAGKIIFIIDVYNTKTNTYTCTETENFISMSNFRNVTAPTDVLIISLYTVINTFSSSFVGTSFYVITSHPYDCLIVILVIWTLKIFVISCITGLMIGGNMTAVKFSNKLTNFMSFINKEMVGEDTVADFIDHFEYTWKKCEGIDTQMFISQLYEKLQLDIKQHLFVHTLLRSQLFINIPYSSLRVYLKYLELQHLRKDAQIIRCNDIQNTMFFVAKGEVDICCAGCHVTVLKRGGVFGNFKKKGYTRQTITAIAKVHVDVLTINSNLFSALIPNNSILSTRIKNINSLSAEFINSLEDGEMSIRTDAMSRSDSSHYESSSGIRLFKRACVAYYRKINGFIKEDGHAYKMYLYFLQVHVAPVSCIFLLLLQFFDLDKILVHVYISLTDLLFLIHVFINFHLYYTDPESGIQIKDPNLIRKRYVKTLLFWVDMFGAIPVWLIAMLFDSSKTVNQALALNRLIRFLHLISYYQTCKRRLILSKMLQWFYIFYLIVFEITVMSLIWFDVACPNMICKYRINTGLDEIIGESHERTRSSILSFLYTVTIFTTAGIRTVVPITMTELSISICMAVVSVVTIALMCGAYTSMLFVNGVTMAEYRRKVYQMMTYIQDCRLSQILIDKTSDYLSTLWAQRRGELLPKLIDEAPFYLKQDIMGAMYKHHLLNHAVFSRTHIDFIRQLVVHFKVYLYLTQQTIVERGDVDDRMYFCHRGEIIEIDEEENEKLLTVGACFGESQGVYNAAHNKTYKAHTAVDLIILKKSDWEYLLNWFPASKEIIYNEIMDISISLGSAGESFSSFVFNGSDSI